MSHFKQSFRNNRNSNFHKPYSQRDARQETKHFFDKKTDLAMEMQHKEDEIIKNRKILLDKLNDAREELESRERNLKERYNRIGEEYKEDYKIKRIKYDLEKNYRHRRQRSYENNDSVEQFQGGQRSYSHSKEERVFPRRDSHSRNHDGHNWGDRNEKYLHRRNTRHEDKKFSKQPLENDQYEYEKNYEYENKDSSEKEYNNEDGSFYENENSSEGTNMYESDDGFGHFDDDNTYDENMYENQYNCEQENSNYVDESIQEHKSQGRIFERNDVHPRHRTPTCTVTSSEHQNIPNEDNNCDLRLTLGRNAVSKRNHSPIKPPHSPIKLPRGSYTNISNNKRRSRSPDLQSRRHRKDLNGQETLENFLAKFSRLQPHPEIPTFDNTDQSFNSLQMVNLVNRLGRRNRWRGMEQMFQFVVKLAGEPRDWVMEEDRLRMRWSFFKSEFLEHFPSDMGYYQTLLRMIRYQKNKKESYNTYFKNKMALLERCSISGRKAVSCLIGGFFLKELRQQCYSFNFETPEELFNFIETGAIPPDAGTPAALTDSSCAFKVVINGHSVEALSDYDCEQVTIKDEEANRIKLFYTRGQKTVIGFKGVPVQTYGECQTMINVQDVSVNINVYVVPNSCQETPIVLGQSLRHHFDINYCKRSGKYSYRSANLSV